MHGLKRIAILSLSIGLWACGSVPMTSPERIEALEQSLTNYYSALRWGHYAEAASLRASRSEAMEPSSMDALDHIRVTSYEITDQVVNEAQDEAKVVASVSFYIDDIGAVRTVMDRHTWWFDKTRKRWFLDGELPDFMDTSRRGF